MRIAWISGGMGDVGIGDRGEPLGEARRTLSARAESLRVRASMPKPKGLEERLKVAGDGIPVHLL